MQHSYLLDNIIELAISAGEILLRYQRSGNLGIEIKEDRSPVTSADKEADLLITDGLKRISPLLIISEEGVKDEIPEVTNYWLVDPLDGTKAFIKGQPDYTVNIGFIENNRAKMGVVYQPAIGKIYWGDVGVGSWSADVENGVIKNRVELNLSEVKNPQSVWRIVASKNHLDEQTKKFIEKYQPNEVVSVSSSLKFCVVAEGLADLYPRFSPTMQWDTAAGHAVLSAAGGKVTNPDGSDFLYSLDKSVLDYLRNGSFIASK